MDKREKMIAIITTKNVSLDGSASTTKPIRTKQSLNCNSNSNFGCFDYQSKENKVCDLANLKKENAFAVISNTCKRMNSMISNRQLVKTDNSSSVPVIDCFDHQPLENDTCDNSITHTQTSCFLSEEYDCTVVSDASKEDSLPKEKIQNMPLDYRIDLSSEMKNNLASCLSSYPSILDLNDMELVDDNSCISIDISESDMESIHSDSFEIDENISSIPQWTNVDVWNR